MKGDKLCLHDSIYIQVNDGGTYEKCGFANLSYVRRLQLYILDYFKPLTFIEVRDFIRRHGKGD